MIEWLKCQLQQHIFTYLCTWAHGKHCQQLRSCATLLQLGNCDASVCVSTTHLSIAGHSRLTIDSPRVASLQHISVHFQERKRGHALQFAGGAPANSYLCRPNDLRCQPSPRAPPKTRSSRANNPKHPPVRRPATYEPRKQHSASTNVTISRGESPVTYQRSWWVNSLLRFYLRTSSGPLTRKLVLAVKKSGKKW